MNEIPFTRLPTKLIFTLDSDLLKMLAILIQQESYWIEHKKIGKDGSFYKQKDSYILYPVREASRQITIVYVGTRLRLTMISKYLNSYSPQ